MNIKEKKIYLKSYDVPEEVFNRILSEYSAFTIKVNKQDIFNYRYGYKDKHKIYHTDEFLVCQEYILDGMCSNIKGCTTWKQCWVRVDATLKKPNNTISGSYAYNYIMRIINRFYNKEEVQQIFSSHEVEKIDYYKQYHVLAPVDFRVLTKFNNTIKYDINGAHCDALCELFPLAKKEFNRMYKMRKKNPLIKAYFNYCVGELCNKGHRLTYNWIVRRTTTKLYELQNYVGGITIYANTDGIVIQDPEHKIEGSKELGQFKVEFEGDTYIYADKSYRILQFGNEKDEKGLCDITGTCLNSVRKDIDLSKGQVVHYDRCIIDGIVVANNLTTETVKIEGDK